MVGLAVYAARSVLADMGARGLAPGFSFLGHEAGFRIGEGPAFAASDSYARAFAVGLANTLRVAGIGVVLATILGLLVALARLSGNPILTRLGAGYVGLFRNTPLLVQLVLWYRAVFLRLPGLSDAVVIGPQSPDRAFAFLSQRGLALPAVQTAAAPALWIAAAVAGIALAWYTRRWRTAHERRTGRPAYTVLWTAAALAIPILVLVVLPGTRPDVSLPERVRFGYASGWVLTPEYAALLVGLVTYTAAFIAEVLRSGIESVGRGQREAGLSVGLREPQLLRLVVLPQALRVAVPPLTSQYLNLTKNSSLAIAVGYPDLYNVGQTISNQTGQAVMVIFMMMGAYLSISLATSLAMNAYSRRVRLVER